MTASAPYLLRIPFVSGLKAQEVRFRRCPESLELINRGGWCWLYVNGKAYAKFPAETTEPGIRQIDEL